MTKNTQNVGRILSVQKIIVGGIEQTPEGAVADGKVTQYMLIRGSTGNDAIVDANGNLVCMLKGSENLPIAQDATGNMVAVMKGNYDGVLKTWKVDDEGRGEMFISDPTDVWGNVVSIGPGELAARLGSPIVWDKRGSLLWYEGFETELTEFENAGGTTNRTPAHKYSGECSLLVTTAATASVLAGVTTVFSHPPLTKSIGFETVFTKHDDHEYIYIDISVMDGTTGHYPSFRIDVQNGKLQYYAPGPTWTDFATGIALDDSYGTVLLWHHLKIVFDISTGKYVRCILDNTEYDMSSYSFDTAADTHLYTRIQAFTSPSINSALTSYFDHFALTSNEPEN